MPTGQSGGETHRPLAKAAKAEQESENPFMSIPIFIPTVGPPDEEQTTVLELSLKDALGCFIELRGD